MRSALASATNAESALVEELGWEDPLVAYRLDLTGQITSCQFQLVPRHRVEVGENLVEYTEAEVCGQGCVGMEIWLPGPVRGNRDPKSWVPLAGTRVCWEHTPTSVKADVVRKFGNRPYGHPNARLFNAARREGLYGPELALAKASASAEPGLLEGSLLDVYGRR